MLRCAFCKTQEAKFDEYSVPICLDCLDAAKQKPIRKTGISSVLVQSLTNATLRFEAATIEFDSIVGDIPSGLPHPDGTQRIQNASRKLAAARKEMECAHDRLADYLIRGIVPEDLTSSEAPPI